MLSCRTLKESDKGKEHRFIECPYRTKLIEKFDNFSYLKAMCRKFPFTLSMKKPYVRGELTGIIIFTWMNLCIDDDDSFVSMISIFLTLMIFRWYGKLCSWTQNGERSKVTYSKGMSLHNALRKIKELLEEPWSIQLKYSSCRTIFVARGTISILSCILQ